MIDQTYRFPEGIAKNAMVKIRDYYVPTSFVVLDIGDEEQDPSIILGRPFLNTTSAIIYIKSRRSTSKFQQRKCTVTSTVTQHMNSPRRIVLGEGAVYPNATRINLSRMDGPTMKERL